MNLDLRNSAEDQSQQMLNAIEPSPLLPIHRHRMSSETMVCLRGRLQVEYYDELKKICTDSFITEPNGTYMAVSIPVGQWHTVHAQESRTCIIEMKNGSYKPLDENDILK